MIDDLKLKELLKDNNLTFSRRVRNDLKENAEYNELVEILSILKKLNISPRLIEKYPTILYTTSENIRKNYKLLKDNNLYNYTPEELIRILSTSYEIVKSNFDYISKEFTKEEINEKICSLTKSYMRVKELERYSQLITKDAILSAMASDLDAQEIYDDVVTCLRANVIVTPNVFKRTPNEIRGIIKICKDNYIKVTDSIFSKTPKELEEIILMCKNMRMSFEDTLLYCPMDKIENFFDSFVDNRIDVDILLAKTTDEKVRKILNIFERFNLNIDYKVIKLDPDKILKIIELCNNYNVKVSEKMFTRTVKDVEEIIKYCKDKDIIVRDTYFERTKKEIENIHNACNLSLKRDDLTYKRDLKEIIDILVYSKTTGLKFTNLLFNNNLDEIERIIATCAKRHVQVHNDVFKTNHRKLDRIISILKQQPLVLPFIPAACNRTPHEVKRIKEIVLKYKVRLLPEMFLRTPYEVERIIRLTRGSFSPKYFQYPLSKLEETVAFCNKNNIKISPNMLDRTTGEIEDILELFNSKNIEVNDLMFLRTPDESEEIIKYCEDKNLEISGDCFRKTPDQFKEAVEVCEKLNIPAVGEVFKRTPDEIRSISKIYERLLNVNPANNSFATTPEEVEKIINLLLENNIEIAGVVFRKKANELDESIKYIKKKYGKEFLLPQIIIYEKDQIDKVFAYCSGRGVLDVVKTCPYILRLSLPEIVERSAYINEIGGDFVENGKFNQVFTWSKKKYLEAKEKQEQDSTGTIK